MKKILFFGLFSLSFHWGYNQTITIIDEETFDPIVNVTLKSEELNITVTTNSKGQANISSLKGAQLIEFERIGYVSVAYSYQVLESADFKIQLKPTDFTLDEIIVSASGWNQNSLDVPNKISTITTRQVALLNPQTAADLLAISGEVFVQKSQQGGGSPMIRGFSTNRLLYTIDGVRMNTAIFRGGNIQNVISLDPFAIENTEIFFGPGSIIYGSDAIGGVMGFRTLTPQFSTVDEPFITGKAVTRYSSINNELTGHIDLNVGWKKWAMITSITHSKYGDLKMGSNGPSEYLKNYYVLRVDDEDKVFENPNPKVQLPTEYSQMNVMQKIRFQPNKKWDFQYGFHYSETSEYARYDRLIETQADGTPISAVWNYGPQKWMMNMFNISHHANNKVYDEMSIRMALQNFEESRVDRRFNNNRLRTQKERVDAYSINIDFVKSIEKRHKLFYGVEFIQNDVFSTASAYNISTGSNIPVSNRYPNSVWNTYSAYLNYQNHLTEKLMLQMGSRFNVYTLQADFSENADFFPFDFTTSEINNNALTGNLGLIYHPSKTFSVSFNASTGYRAPNVDDMGKIFDFQAGDVIVPNTNLKAEYVYSGELNISKVVGKFLKLNVSGYFTQLENALVRREYQVNGQDSILYDGEMSKVYAIQNAAFANVYGTHIGFEVKLPHGFGFSTKFNYQKGIEEMDNGVKTPSRHAAPWYGVSRLTYVAHRFNMQLYVLYSGEVSHANLNEEERQKTVIYAKDENGNPYSPGWYTLNFKAMYYFEDNFSISGGVENLTDVRYRPYSSGMVAPGRNFVMSLRVIF